MAFLGIGVFLVVGWFASWKQRAAMFVVTLAVILALSGGSLTHW